MHGRHALMGIKMRLQRHAPTQMGFQSAAARVAADFERLRTDNQNLRTANDVLTKLNRDLLTKLAKVRK